MMPVSASASGTLGVTKVARGSRPAFSIPTPPHPAMARRCWIAAPYPAPAAGPLSFERLGHGVGDGAVAQHADLDGIGADIAQAASICARTISGGMS